MIRAYFGMLLRELAEHPEVAGILGVEPTDELKRAARTRESAVRETLGKMKQFASWFTHGIPGGGTLRRQIFESRSGEAVLGSVERFFAAQNAQVACEPELAVASSYPFRS